MPGHVMRWIPTLTPRRLRQLWYAPLLALAMGLMMLRLLLLARILDLPAFAAYSAGILLSSTFCMVGCLGLQSVLQREWPVNLVHGQKRRAVIRATQCYLLTLATAAVLYLFAALGIAGAGMQLVAVGILHGVSQQAFLVATTESRSGGDALGYALQQLIRSGLVLGLGVTVAMNAGAPLFVLAVEAVLSALLSMHTLRGSLARVALSWRGATLLAWRRLPEVPWVSACTMMGVMLVAFATLNADRWIAARLLTPAGFAQYSFVAILLAVAQALQALINASVYPLLARRYASFGKSVTFRICWRTSAVFLVVGLLVSMPFIALVRQVIATWYPQYLEAAALVPLLVLVGVLRIADFWSSFLLIAGHEMRMLLVNLSTLVCAVGAWLAWRAPLPEAATTPMDIGLLAALLTCFGSVFAALAAWTARRS
jgi:O-antigen/teichoic acid export membrane protein